MNGNRIYFVAHCYVYQFSLYTAFILQCYHIWNINVYIYIQIHQLIIIMHCSFTQLHLDIRVL